MTTTRSAGLDISWPMLIKLMAELARRGQGHREGGSFLLAHTEPGSAQPSNRRPRVLSVAYYDDLDPGSLTGGISFGAAGYSALNGRFRAERGRVVGDIDKRPRGCVGQSSLGDAHPMSAMKRHIAIIAT